MRIAGLDVGSRTIGVALSDALGLTAQPEYVWARQGTRADVAAILGFCREREVTEIVVGLPLELDGQEGRRARLVRGFARALAAAFGGPVHLWDERMTTVAAERVLLEADLSRRKRSRHVDKLAAALILQGYLDHLRQGACGSVPEAADGLEESE